MNMNGFCWNLDLFLSFIGFLDHLHLQVSQKPLFSLCSGGTDGWADGHLPHVRAPRHLPGAGLHTQHLRRRRGRGMAKRWPYYSTYVSERPCAVRDVPAPPAKVLGLPVRSQEGDRYIGGARNSVQARAAPPMGILTPRRNTCSKRPFTRRSATRLPNMNSLRSIEYIDPLFRSEKSGAHRWVYF